VIPVSPINRGERQQTGGRHRELIEKHLGGADPRQSAGANQYRRRRPAKRRQQTQEIADPGVRPGAARIGEAKNDAGESKDDTQEVSPTHLFSRNEAMQAEHREAGCGVESDDHPRRSGIREPEVDEGEFEGKQGTGEQAGAQGAVGLESARPRQRAQRISSSKAIAERRPDCRSGLTPWPAILMVTC
jgi:hypothetical protein